MRTSFYYPLTLVLAVGLFGCQPETLTGPAGSDPDLAEMEAELQQYDTQLRAEIAAIDKEVEALEKSAAVTVAAGSDDALAAAIAEAGPGGTVILESGVHTESASVVIPHQLRLEGEEGAILIVNTGTHDFVNTALDPALHVLDAPRTIIRGIDIRPAGEAGGVAVLVESSDRTLVLRNTISDYQFGVILEASDRVYIMRNTLYGTPLWQTNEAPFATGILTMKGDHARVYGNEVNAFAVGVWACSRFGYVAGNEIHENVNGVVLCRATPGTWRLPSGEMSGSDYSAYRTAVFYNDSHDNLDINIQTIDGANHNFLGRNTTANPGRVDYEFTTETDRYSLGFLLPETFENRAYLPSESTYVDCGRDNIVVGGTEIPADETNCF